MDPVPVDVTVVGQGAMALLELNAAGAEELIADYPDVSWRCMPRRVSR